MAFIKVGLMSLLNCKENRERKGKVHATHIHKQFL